MSANGLFSLLKNFQWLVIPHGRDGTVSGYGKSVPLRLTLRVAPQISSDFLKRNGTEFRIRDLDRASDPIGVDAVRDWPGFVAGIDSLEIGISKLKSTQEVPAVATIRWNAALEKHGVSKEMSSRLWKALVFDDVLVAPVSSCGKGSSSSSPEKKEKALALPHARGASLLRNTIGQLYSTSLAMMRSTGKDRNVANNHVLAKMGAQQQVILKPVGDLMASLSSAESIQVLMRQLGNLKVKMEDAKWTANRMAASGFALSNSAHELIAKRIKTWTSSDRKREDAHYNIGDFVIDRMLALASDVGTYSEGHIDGTNRAPDQGESKQDGRLEFHQEISKLTLHSWLLESFGLTIDLEVPGLDLGTEPIALYVKKINHKQGQFAPALQARVITSSDSDWFPEELQRKPEERRYRAGCVRLAKKPSDNDRAPFVLEQLDIDSVSEKLLQVAQNLKAQYEAGIPSTDRGAMLGTLYSSGMSLLMRRPSDLQREAANRLHDVQASAANCAVDLYSEDLVVGYRPDFSVLAPRDTGTSCRIAWKSLVARTLERLRVSGGRWEKRLKSLPEDEGLVTTHSRIADGVNGTALVFEELFCFHGENLAASFFKGDPPRVDDPALPIDIDYWTGALPPQRYGWGYRVGMRAVYVDGRSLSTAEAASTYDDALGDCRLGAEAVGGTSIGDPAKSLSAGADYYVPYFRYEPIQPPDVHLTSPLDRSKLPTERADHVLVASQDEDILARTSSRVFVPPRVSEDIAIRSGAFDDRTTRNQAKAGAFKDVLLNEDGSFPAVGNSFIAHLFGAERGGETAYVEGESPHIRHRPYLPDPWATRLIIGLYRGADDRLMKLEYFDYYDADRTWPGCRRLELRVEADLGELQEEMGFELSWPLPDVLLVRLARGTQLKLRLWHEMTESMLASSGVVEAMATWLSSPEAAYCGQALGIPDCCDMNINDTRDRLIKCLSQWDKRQPFELSPHLAEGMPSRMINLTSFSMLNPAREIDIAHAVPKPVRAPKFSEADHVVGRRATRVPVTESTVAKRFEVMRDKPGLTVAEFGGDIEIHRTSMQRIDCDAEWDEIRDDIGTRTQRTRYRRHMFTVDGIKPVLPTFDEGTQLSSDNDLLNL